MSKTETNKAEVKQYYVLCGTDKKMIEMLKKGGFNTNTFFLLKVRFNSRLGKKLQKEAKRNWKNG